MAANTILITFKIQQDGYKDKEVMDLLKNLGKILFHKAIDPNVINLGGPGELLMVYPGPDGSHATLRLYSHGLVTLDIQHYIANYVFDFTMCPYNMEYIRSLENQLSVHFGEKLTSLNAIYTPIKRGQKVWPYAVSADERIQEFDYDDVLYNSQSEFQKITIMHSKSNGNVLLLDGDLMLGESDLIYTETVAAIGKEDYTDKEVLILGGGDGGLLHELLKLKPKHILMAEIDEKVIQACRTHMRGVCGDSMDNFDGPHYKIVIEDCVKVLYECIKHGRSFDFVINDLTEFPVEKNVKSFFGYDFETTSLITELSLKVLKHGGKVLARGNCTSAFDYKIKFENDIKTMNCHFLCKTVFVPSFGENYDLYEIWKKDETTDKAAKKTKFEN